MVEAKTKGSSGGKLGISLKLVPGDSGGSLGETPKLDLTTGPASSYQTALESFLGVPGIVGTCAY